MATLLAFLLVPPGHPGTRLASLANNLGTRLGFLRRVSAWRTQHLTKH